MTPELSIATMPAPARRFVLVADTLVQFLLLIGIAVTPPPGGSDEAFVVRILKIGLASLYALAALSLVERPRGGVER